MPPTTTTSAGGYLQPVVDSVQQLTTEGIPILIQIKLVDALLFALALSIPILIYFLSKKATA